MLTRQKLASALAVLNTLLGLAALCAPLVSGNRDRILNIRPGFLFGVLAVNWLHALIHLIVGIIGLPLRTTSSEVTSYLRLQAMVFSLLSILGWIKARHAQSIYFVMGMALNVPATVLHTVYAGLGLWFGYKQSGAPSSQDGFVSGASPRGRERQVAG